MTTDTMPYEFARWGDKRDPFKRFKRNSRTFVPHPDLASAGGVGKFGVLPKRGIVELTIAWPAQCQRLVTGEMSE